MIKFAVKTGIAGAAIYYVKEQDVFKHSTKSIESYNRTKAALSPYIKEVTSKIPLTLPEIPPTENLCQSTKEYWNKSVTATFRFLVNLPDYIKYYSKQGKEALLKNDEIRKFTDSFNKPIDTTQKLTSKK